MVPVKKREPHLHFDYTRQETTRRETSSSFPELNCQLHPGNPVLGCSTECLHQIGQYKMGTCHE